MTQQGQSRVPCPLCETLVDPARDNWCPGCSAPVQSPTFTQLLEADEALRAYQRSYDALAAGWTEWGKRRTLLAEQLDEQRFHNSAQPQTHHASTSPAPTASGSTAPAPEEPAPASEPVPAEHAPAEPVSTAEAPATEPAVNEPVATEPDTADPEPFQPAAFQAPEATSTPAASTTPAHDGGPFATPGDDPVREPARASAVGTNPTAPVRAPRRSMSEVFTAPVLLGVSGASLMIAAAIVAVAITWATATPVVRGLLVLVVAAAVAALAAWLRRLHLVITSGAVGIVSMGFAGTSAVAFLSDSPAASVYSAAFAFLIAGAAGIGLSRFKLAWVGPAAAVALAGFAVALTSTITTQTADAGALWAWSLTGVATAVGLAATSEWWPWRSAQQIALWAGLSWLIVTGFIAALWLWFGNVEVSSAIAAVIPLGAIVWQSRSKRQLAPATLTISAAVLVTLVAPSFASVVGAAPWIQFTVLAGAIAAVAGFGRTLSAARRRHVLIGVAPGYVLAWLTAVIFTIAGMAHRVDLLLKPTTGTRVEFTFDVGVGLTALLLAVAAAALGRWKLAELNIPAWIQHTLVMSGPLAGIAAIMALTVAITDQATDALTPWVWVVAGAGLSLVSAATRTVWERLSAQRIALWAAAGWTGVVGAVVAGWAWSGDLTVAGSVAGFIPVAVLIGMVRWLPRTPVVIAVALATLVAPSIGFVVGLDPWPQVLVASVVIAVAVGVGRNVPRSQKGAIAIGLVPAFTVVVVSTGNYGLENVLQRMVHAMGGEPISHGLFEFAAERVDVWAGAAALLTGLAVAGVRFWRLRDLGPTLDGVLKVAGVVGALSVVIGVVIGAYAGVGMAPARMAYSALTLALAVAAVLLMLARALWVERGAKTVSSLSGVVCAAFAGAHGVWGLAASELHPLAGLGVALVPVAVLAVWGWTRPAQGTALAALLVTAVGAALASALGATPVLALAFAVALAALAAWTVTLLPERQQNLVLIGVSPALGWGVLTGLWVAGEAALWVDPTRWAPHTWMAVTALIAAVALAATRTGPWRAWTRTAESTGALLVLVSAPVALGVGAAALEVNQPALALGSALGGAFVAAAGLAWWRNRTARRLTRIGVVLWATAAGVMGWLNVAFWSWHFTTTLVLSIAALVLLVVASRWWPRPALAPTTLLLTGAPAALAVRAEWGFTSVAVAGLVGAVLVLLLMLMVPGHLRFVGLLGALPALAVGAVAALSATATGALEAVAGGRSAVIIEDHWWALGLVVALGVAAVLVVRLGMGSVVTATARLVLALALVSGVIVATATFAMVAAPETPGDQARLLLAPGVAAVLGAVVVLWTVRWERLLAAGGAGAGARPGGVAFGGTATSADASVAVDAAAVAQAVRPLAPLTARWGAVAWVTVLGIALHAWVFHEDIHWLAGAALVLAIAAGLAVAGTRWPYLGLLPAVALITVMPFAVVPVTLSLPFTASACLAAVLVAASTWGVRHLTVARRRAVLAGLIPAALGALVPALLAVLITVLALTEHIVTTGSASNAVTGAPLTWWHVGVFAASVGAVLAWRGAHRVRGWLLLSVMVVTAAMLPVIWTVVLLAVTALTLLFAGRWLQANSVTSGVAVGIAMLWSVGSDLALGVTATTATVIVGAVAVGWRTRAHTWGAVVAPVTALLAGVFLARALDAATVAFPAGVGLSMVAVLALLSANRDRLREPVAYTALVVTSIAPLWADSAAMMGLAFALGAATWWRLFSAGLTWAKWACAVTASAGAAALLTSINIQVIEAYTAVPAAALLWIGVQWLRDKPELRSITALAPGLGAALIPSYLALVLEPDALWRTIALVGAVIVLALIGLRLRWFAPILGTAVTAVVISVLQIIAGGNLVVRLIAFAVVGALLLAIASYFERLKELR